MKVAYFLLLLSISMTSCAETGSEQMESNSSSKQLHVDLNKDNIKDVITVIKTSLGNRIIVLEEVERAADSLDKSHGKIIAAINVGRNKTSFDDVEINSAGGLSVYSGCDICGRETYVTEYKVAYRKGEYIVAGYTLSEADRQTATFSSCDVNLLTGDAELMVDDETVRRKGKDRYFNVAQLSYSYKPEVCDDI